MFFLYYLVMKFMHMQVVTQLEGGSNTCLCETAVTSSFMYTKLPAAILAVAFVCHPLLLLLHWCIFPGSPCHMQTMTDGNALCSLMSFIFQPVTLTRPYRVTYLQYEQYNEAIMCAKMIRNPHYEQYDSLRESLQRCIMI